MLPKVRLDAYRRPRRCFHALDAALATDLLVRLERRRQQTVLVHVRGVGSNGIVDRLQGAMPQQAAKAIDAGHDEDGVVGADKLGLKLSSCLTRALARDGLARGCGSAAAVVVVWQVKGDRPLLAWQPRSSAAANVACHSHRVVVGDFVGPFARDAYSKSRV